MLASLLLVVTPLAAVTPAPAAPSPLETLLAAERAFARTSVEHGIRGSFLEFFAPDGLAFQPGPLRVREVYGGQPAPAARPPVTLDWEPLRADVSAAGDLGWTSGPYTLKDDSGKDPTSHGWYFSVWKKQGDGAWKVVADMGVPAPAPAGPRATFAPAHAAPAPAGAPLSREAFLALDDELSRGCAAGVAAECLAGRLHDDVQLNREGFAPRLGREAARAFLLRETAQPDFEPLGGELSRSGDLGYTWGRYQADAPDDARTGESGYYLRVWRRTPEGFRVAADVAKADAPAGARP